MDSNTISMPTPILIPIPVTSSFPSQSLSQSPSSTPSHLHLHLNPYPPSQSPSSTPPHPHLHPNFYPNPHPHPITTSTPNPIPIPWDEVGFLHGSAQGDHCHHRCPLRLMSPPCGGAAFSLSHICSGLQEVNIKKKKRERENNNVLRRANAAAEHSTLPRSLSEALCEQSEPGKVARLRGGERGCAPRPLLLARGEISILVRSHPALITMLCPEHGSGMGPCSPGAGSDGLSAPNMCIGPFSFKVGLLEWENSTKRRILGQHPIVWHGVGVPPPLPPSQHTLQHWDGKWELGAEGRHCAMSRSALQPALQPYKQPYNYKQ